MRTNDRTRLTAILLALLISAAATHAGMRQFTDVDGRTMTADLVSAGETAIQVKLKNGKMATIEISRLSESDRSYVEDWAKQRGEESNAKTSEEAARKRAAEISAKMTEYCKRQLGRKVGNGECWTLADEAFKACGLKRPGADQRVWGRLLDLKKEGMEAGDIVEYRSAKFSNGDFTGPEHTAVVVKGGRRSAIVAEQNWGGGNKTVRENGFDPRSLIAGTVAVYRPE